MSMPSYLMSAIEWWLSAPATMIFFRAGMTNASIGLWFLHLIWPIYQLTGSRCKNEMLIPSGQESPPAVLAASPSSASSEATLPAVEVPPRRSVAQRRSGLCGPRTSLGALVRRWPSVPLEPRAPRPSVSVRRRQSAFPRLVEDGWNTDRPWDL